MESDLKESKCHSLCSLGMETYYPLRGKDYLCLSREYRGIWKFSVLSCIHQDVCILLLGSYYLPISAETCQGCECSLLYNNEYVTLKSKFCADF